MPIDDERHWSYSVTFRRQAPIDQAAAREGQKELLPDYHLVGEPRDTLSAESPGDDSLKD